MYSFPRRMWHRHNQSCGVGTPGQCPQGSTGTGHTGSHHTGCISPLGDHCTCHLWSSLIISPESESRILRPSSRLQLTLGGGWPSGLQASITSSPSPTVWSWLVPIPAGKIDGGSKWVECSPRGLIAILTHDIEVGELALHGVGVDLTHVAVLVSNADIPGRKVG